MTARNTPPGSLLGTTNQAYTFGGLQVGSRFFGAGSTTAVGAVYPYTPPTTGQQWPRPY